jgi:hypothetical protein
LRAIQEGNSCLLSGGAPDSPVLISFLFWRSRPLKKWSRWRTGHCPVPPSDRWLGHASRADCAADRWLTGQSGAPPDSPVNYSRTPLIASRERRLRRGWLTGQSSAPPDSPVIYSRTLPSSPESELFTETGPGAPDTVRCTTGQSGAPRPKLSLAVHSQLFSKLFSPVSIT